MQTETLVMNKEIKDNGFIHAVYEESPYGILVFNSTLNIVDWNPAVEKLIGLSKEACIGKNILDVFAKKGSTAIKDVKGTMVVAESVSLHFAGGLLSDIKVSIIVDKSGALSGGTLILTCPVHSN